jgi:hypothetical protein
MIFNFALQSLNEVHPWGPEHRLHWFGLTCGWYWINLAGTTLFEYTDEIRNHWKISMPGAPGRFVDYQVARLWEDVNDLLPAILEPVPPDVLSQAPQVEKIIERFYRSNRLSDIGWDSLAETVEEATGWWSMRLLDSSHLTASPTIRIWRDRDVVNLRWDTRRGLFDGIEVWTAACGEYTVSIDEFIAEVKGFRDRLRAAMQTRVDQIEKDGGIKGVTIDVARLLEEQHDRFSNFDARFNRPTITDWANARAALNEARRAFPELTA